MDLQLLKALQRALQIFDDIRRQQIRLGQAVQIGEGLIFDPEKVKACFVALKGILHIIAVEVAVLVLRWPYFRTIVTIYRIIALDEGCKASIGQGVLLQCEVRCLISNQTGIRQIFEPLV